MPEPTPDPKEWQWTLWSRSAPTWAWQREAVGRRERMLELSQLLNRREEYVIMPPGEVPYEVQETT